MVTQTLTGHVLCVTHRGYVELDYMHGESYAMKCVSKFLRDLWRERDS